MVTDIVKMDSAIMWLMHNNLWIVAPVKIPRLRRESVQIELLEFRVSPPILTKSLVVYEINPDQHGHETILLGPLE